MARTLRYLLLLLCTFASAQVWAQGGIEGFVKDASGEPLTGASIRVTEGGIFRNGALSGVDGDFLIKPLNTGDYEVEISYVGLSTKRTTGIKVIENQNTPLSVTLEKPRSGSKTDLEEVIIVAYAKPLINTTAPGSINTLTDKEIEKNGRSGCGCAGCYPTGRTANGSGLWFEYRWCPGREHRLHY